MKNEFINKIDNFNAVIGVIGLGYVGLPLSLCYQNAGHKVIGFDIDNKKVNSLLESKTYIKHITSDSISEIISKGFEPTTDFSKIKDVDAIIICVPTPLSKYREPDLSYILETLKTIKPYLRKGQVISLESTTYPGTTDEEIVPVIKKEGFKVGEDFFVVYSPEREDPGNKHFNTKTIPKVIGGYTPNCTEVGLKLYNSIVDHVVKVSSTKTAEMVKILENIHRSVNIGLVNEMKMIADKMGIDIFEVINAAATKPFGFTAYYPGPGIGGHCIPIDPFYLTWKAREYNVHTRFIELAGEINRHMPDFVTNKITKALNNRKKPLSGSKILILGISYKKNIDDCRVSPSMEVMNLLKEKKAELSYSDPYWPSFPFMTDYNYDLNSIEINADNLGKFDCTVILTDHDDFDYETILKHSSLIVDTRGVYKGNHSNVIKA